MIPKKSSIRNGERIFGESKNKRDTRKPDREIGLFRVHDMKILKYILSLSFIFLLGLFQNKLEAKVILAENEEIRVLSAQDFQKQNQESKWLGLLYLQEENKLQNQPSLLHFSTESFHQNFTQEICPKIIGNNLGFDFLFSQTSSSHQRKQIGVNELFIGDTELVDAWGKLFDAPDAIRKNIDLLEDVTNWPASWKFTKSGDGMVVKNGSGKQLGTIYSDKIVAPGRKVAGESDNALLNRVPLVKNMKYDVDGFIYETDEFGRVLRTNADLDDVVRIRLGNQQIKAVDVKDGVRGTDQGGHIVGSRFFGPGEQINLYPQSANLNQGAWKQMENTWADAMVAGKDVKIKVEAIFEGISQRPSRFRVDYIIDGQPFRETFTNQ